MATAPDSFPGFPNGRSTIVSLPALKSESGGKISNSTAGREERYGFYSPTIDHMWFFRYNNHD